MHKKVRCSPQDQRLAGRQVSHAEQLYDSLNVCTIVCSPVRRPHLDPVLPGRPSKRSCLPIKLALVTTFECIALPIQPMHSGASVFAVGRINCGIKQHLHRGTPALCSAPCTAQ